MVEFITKFIKEVMSHLLFVLAPRRGLRGVWLAMCVELCGRGAIFLARLAGPRWQRRGLAAAAAGSEGNEGSEGMQD